MKGSFAPELDGKALCAVCTPTHYLDGRETMIEQSERERPHRKATPEVLLNHKYPESFCYTSNVLNDKEKELFESRRYSSRG